MIDPRSRMLAAVRHILNTEGSRALTSRNVIRVAGLPPKGRWIKKHFNNTDGLLTAYLVQADFWLRLDDTIGTIRTDDLNDCTRLKALVVRILHHQLDCFFDSREMQELMVWGISRPRSRLKREFSDARERAAAELLTAADRLLGSREIPFLPMAVFLVGACYFLPFHAAQNLSTFCGLDLTTEEGKKEVYDAVAYLVNDVL
ncbi:hypothetical protein [Parapedobacter soli]|uniref:hypothetical protein n=1 Tax=Parapedobacter soli TaxID=416955 RepID=UPI0021C93154|nr:hypothetical protein [Parapedobacter soli]